MASFISTGSNSDSRCSRRTGQWPPSLEGSQLTGYNVRNSNQAVGAGVDSNSYLAGYLNGLAAANVRYNEALLLPSTSLNRFDNMQSSLTPKNSPSNGLLPGGSNVQSMLLSAVPTPDSCNSSFDSASLLSLSYPAVPAETTWLQGLSATSSLSHPPLATGQNLWPGPVDFQYSEPYPSEFQSFTGPEYEDYDTNLAGFMTNGEQALHGFNLPIIPETQLNSIPYMDTPFGSNTCMVNGESLQKPKALSYESLQAIQRPTHQISPNIDPPPTKAKSDARSTYEVFRVLGTKTRSRFKPEARRRTALTRKIGACAVCRMKKLRCNMELSAKYVPCGRCSRTPPNLLAQPCCRIEIIDVKLFRLGSTANPEFLRHWTLSKELGKGLHLLEDGTTIFEAPRRVFLTQDISITSFQVSVSRCQPGPDDATAFTWTHAVDGSKKVFDLPPYYISDMDEARRNIQRYIHEARQEYTVALLANRNPIIRKTFAEAERYLEESSSALISTALTLWSATRLIERTWLICGEDLLGLCPMEENFGPCLRNRSIDAIPATPLMDTQLDELSIGAVLIPMGKKFLRLLKERTLARKKEYWYEIYLATFIVLCSFEQILADVVDFTARVGVVSSPKYNSGPSLSDEYYHACKIMLAYFHFASAGATPLSLDWHKPEKDTSTLNQQQISYLQWMQQEMRRQDLELKALKDAPMYKTEMYWCHQMLYADWKAEMPHQGEFLPFKEKDFMCS